MEQAAVEKRRNDDASLTEDPEAKRRAEAQMAESIGTAEDDFDALSLELYGSARVHAVNSISIRTGERTSSISDGQSRIGARGDWQYRRGKWLFARYEAGIDLVENFSTRGDLFGNGGLTTRLAFAGLDMDGLTLVYGQNWSAYYQVAGMTDRFSIFGGSASGVYNAASAGQFTGTGRAKDVIQARVFLDSQHGVLRTFKPLNVNLQYQFGQGIPGVDGQEYTKSWGLSTIFESEHEFGVGIAYNRAVVPEGVPEIEAASIDGDATALAITARKFGDGWYVAALVSRLDNMDVTNEGQYFNAYGFELYGQWEFRPKWWLIAGGNWLNPDSDDPDTGQFRSRYYVLGARYAIRSFERMWYLEYRYDESRAVDGSPGSDEVTIGLRWDFGRKF